jgi:hypothetical protein
VNYTETGTVFYSLNPEALKVYAFKDYSILFIIQKQYCNCFNLSSMKQVKVIMIWAIDTVLKNQFN